MAPDRRIRSLANRQAVQVGLVAIGALILSGAIEMGFSYRETLAQTRRLQAAQAIATEREIEQYLDTLSKALSNTTQLPWGAEGLDPSTLHREFLRVTGLFKSISEVRIERDDGRLLLVASQAGPKYISAEGWESPPSDMQAEKPVQGSFGQPYFVNGLEPYVKLTFAKVLQRRATMTVTLSLRMIAEIVTRLDATAEGTAYLVDGQNHLIVHPVQTEILKRRDLSDWRPVSLARASLVTRGPTTAAVEGQDFNGRSDVIATATYVRKTGWLLFLEQPRATVLEPVYATLRRTALLVALATLLTAAVSAWSGRRMARPIVELRAASARIASGHFDTPVDIATGDELELLGDDLNRMAGRLQRFYEELEEQVAVRTDQLLQARDAAERASQSKTRFLAAASHDLRQPMHTIGLLVSVLANRLRDPEQLAIAANLGASVDTMERLFNSLLNISKLDAGAVQARPETFPVQDLLDRIVQRFEDEASERGLQLRVCRCCAIVRSDPGLLESCLGNLVANALNYTRTGRVTVGCRRRGQTLAIQVHDTGPGIAAEHLDLIFEEFVRLPGADVAQARGLGLGLAIVRRTAALLDHRLDVQSTLGRGSMFELTLDQLPATMLAPPSMADPTVCDGDLQGVFALLVDDDEGNRAALQALCMRWGCHVASAANAEAALEELDQHLRSPDIVLTDLRLGGHLDGLELIARLRGALEEAIPCLLITADTAASVLDRAKAAGVEVLHKPAAAERVYTAVCAAVQHGRQGVGKVQADD